MPREGGVITADLHVHPWRLCSNDGGADRRADALRAAKFGLQLAAQYGKLWLFLGDLKHIRGVWDQVSLSGLLELCREAVAAGVELHFLSGNGYHDGLNVKETGASGLDPFRAYGHVYTEPMIYTARHPLVSWFHQPVAVWPWQPSYDQLPSFIAEARRRGARLLLGHGYLEGALVGPDEIRLPGLGVGLDRFGLRGSATARVFDRAWFGDIHLQQTLGDASGRTAAIVEYPGSPYQQNKGERNQPDKGVLMVDQRSLVTMSVATPKVPKYVVGEIRAARDWDAIRRRDVAGDFVHLTYDRRVVSEEQLLEWVEVLEARWHQFIPLPQPKTARKKTTPVTPNMTIDQMVEAYVAQTPPPEGLTAAQVLAVGKRFLHEVAKKEVGS